MVREVDDDDNDDDYDGDADDFYLRSHPAMGGTGQRRATNRLPL